MDGSRSWFTSRKFQLAAFLLALAAPVMLWFGKINAEQWVGLTQWVFGLYCGSNLGAKMVPTPSAERSS